jgi:hypothetical protein
MRAHLLAQIDDAVGLVALEAERRRLQHRPGDPEPAPRQLEQVEIEVDQPLPRPGVDLLELLGVAGPVRRLAAVGAQRRPLATLPVLLGVAGVGDALVADAIGLGAALERHGQPGGAAVELLTAAGSGSSGPRTGGRP